jgi:hypothetical protein
MILREIYKDNKPILVKLHYFSLDDLKDALILSDNKLKKDHDGRWYLPQYNTSGSKFDQIFTTLIRNYGRPNTVELQRSY